MICCLNPDCPDPQNPIGTNFCVSCGTGLIPLLRNRYRVIAPLGGGGFARTYLAEDIDKLEEQCVVKQLAPQAQGSWSLKKQLSYLSKKQDVCNSLDSIIKSLHYMGTLKKTITCT